MVLHVKCLFAYFVAAPLSMPVFIFYISKCVFFLGGIDHVCACRVFVYLSDIFYDFMLKNMLPLRLTTIQFFYKNNNVIDFVMTM